MSTETWEQARLHVLTTLEDTRAELRAIRSRQTWTLATLVTLLLAVCGDLVVRLAASGGVGA